MWDHGISFSAPGPVPSLLPSLPPLQNRFSSETVHILFPDPLSSCRHGFCYISAAGIFFSILIFPNVSALPAVSLHITTLQDFFFFAFGQSVLSGTPEAEMRLRATQALRLVVLISAVSWG